MVDVSRLIVKQFGYSNAGGALQNIADGDLATFWKPYPDTFEGYTIPPFGESGNILTGYSRPAIEFDFLERVRIPFFRAYTETTRSLPPGWWVVSDSPATSVADTVQAGDRNGGYITIDQINGGQPIKTLAATREIRGRYWRYVSIRTPL